MSEEKEIQEGGLSTIKKTIIGIATTAVTAIGGYVATHIDSIFGGEKEETKTEVTAPTPAASPVIINLENNNTNQQKQTAAPTQVIRERIIEKPATQPVKPATKPVEDEEDPW
jgi:flagellar basal body-associated protein FliL